MAVCSYTAITIIDDILVRLKMKFLLKPAYATPGWAILTIAYLGLVASMIGHYWDVQQPEFLHTVGDEYWFAYITLLTVGLGDLYLQPQGLFTGNVIKWTILLLYGFITMAAFLGKFSEWIESFIPKDKESFQRRLARTGIFGSGIEHPLCESLEILRKLVEINEAKVLMESLTTEAYISNPKHQIKQKYRSSFRRMDRQARTPDGRIINDHRIEILTEKKNIVIRLLEDNQSEFEDRMNAKIILGHTIESEEINSRCEIDPKLCCANLSLTTLEELHCEEEILESILFQTKKFRRYIEMHVGDTK
uniref:Potassium channel domain-containing protein n=1 Tax=Pseudo-nitzschia australis TaxID=44445 RepID=A0A7S4AXC1_9STRA|mmetsp:Transcript_28751/g.60246  ORF Transcript_28751/g.60246 Transcript_28751/m.60246 type:complete len:306 (+) Transcript_28751:748-1665(+)